MHRLEIIRSIRNIKDRLLGEPNDKPEWLLAQDKVEQLVAEGRTPFLTGRTISGGESQWDLLYQVPPRGFNPKTFGSYQTCCGDYRWVDPNGSHLSGTSHRLTIEQATYLEQRIHPAKE